MHCPFLSLNKHCTYFRHSALVKSNFIHFYNQFSTSVSALTLTKIPCRHSPCSACTNLSLSTLAAQAQKHALSNCPNPLPRPYKIHTKLSSKRPVFFLPSSQTSVSMLTANALLCRCCSVWPPDDCLAQIVGFCFSIVPIWYGLPCDDSTPSSRSIMSDEDSESDDFFRCWPNLELYKIDLN